MQAVLRVSKIPRNEVRGGLDVTFADVILEVAKTRTINMIDRIN